MDIFGGQWENHTEKIKEAWMKEIKDEDTILIPGDISWALKLDDAHIDLSWIEELPGRKILVKGNHDYWWQSISKLKGRYAQMYFLQNTFYFYENYGICGTRGWICPNSTNFTEHDQKIYLREINRLKHSLDQAVKKNVDKIIVMMHYPPTNEKFEKSGFIELIESYGVSKVIYAHLHGESYFHTGLKGLKNDVMYHLVSCDYLECRPLKLL